MDCDNANDSTRDTREMSMWAKIPSTGAEYSDWQIDVTFATADSSHVEEYRTTSASYLVHRYRLGFSSDYFQSIFRASGFAESEKQRSIIKFPIDTPVSLTIRDFENLLNYFYLDNGETLKVDDPNDVFPLMYFADYFRIEKLRSEWINCIFEHIMEDDVLESWSAKLFVVAQYLQDEDIMNSIACACYNSHERFAGVWNSLDTSDAKRNLLHRMIKFRGGDSEQEEKFKNTQIFRFMDVQRDGWFAWHLIVTHAIESSPQTIDRDLFSMLTKDEIMTPLIKFSAEEKIVYLKHENLLGLDKVGDSSKLTYLQQLCVADICCETPNFTNRQIVEGLRGLNPLLTESILLHMIECNQNQTKAIEGLEKQNKNLERKIEDLQRVKKTRKKRKRY